MTTESSRPCQGAADADGDADNTTVDPSNDKIDVRTATVPSLSVGQRDRVSQAIRTRALALAGEGLYVFPLDHPSWPECRGAHQMVQCDGKRGKHPVGSWKEAASVNEADIMRMFNNGPFNIGIACGPSKLLVVDEDGPNDLAAYAAIMGLTVPDTRVTRTGRGAHRLFRHDHGAMRLGNGEGLLADFDVNIRGDGGYIVGPGSTHQNGTAYDFLNPGTRILPLPNWLLKAVTTRKPRQAPPPSPGIRVPAHSGPIPQGQRHSGLLSYAGRLVNSRLSLDEVRPVFLERFKDCVQPPGAVPAAKYEDAACKEEFTQQEAVALLEDVLARYREAPDAPDLADEWKASSPMSLVRHRQRPPFPVDALPEPLSTMVAAVAEFTQTDTGMAGTTCLAMLAAAAGGRVQLEVRPGWREPVNLFTVTVAGPGERKSAVQAVMSLPLQEAEEELANRVRAQLLEATITKDVATKAAEAARAKAGKVDPDERHESLKEAIGAMRAADAIDVPVLPRLLADDITPERLAGLLAEQGGRLAVVSAEGGIFDIIAGRYSAGVPSLDVWLKGHSGDQLRIDRQSRETEVIPHPALTLSLMIQPSVLTAIAGNKTFRGRGLLARFLYSVPVSMVGHRVVGAAVVPADVSAGYGSLIRCLALTLAEWLDPAVLQLSPQAAEMLDEEARSLEPQLGEDGELHHIADWGSKFVGAVARIAALVHLAEHPQDGWRLPVEACSLERAIRLGAYYKGQALYAFDQMRVDPALSDADYLLGVVRRLDAPVVSRRDLHVNASRSRFPTAKDVDGPLKLLEEHGYLLSQPETATKGRGRPSSPRWLVHPSVLTAEATEAT